MFPNPPFDPSLSKEEIKKAVKEFEDKKDTLSKYGSLKVIVPAIPFVSPEEKELRFGVKDIEKNRKFHLVE